MSSRSVGVGAAVVVRRSVSVSISVPKKGLSLFGVRLGLQGLQLVVSQNETYHHRYQHNDSNSGHDI